MVARAYNAPCAPPAPAGRSRLSACCGRLAAHGRAGRPARPAVRPALRGRASPIGLRGDVRPRQYLGVVGPRSAWLGVETGEAELWVHPLKLASGFRLDFRVPEYGEPIRGADVARTRRGAAGGHDDHVQPRHLHRPPARPRPARRAGAAGAPGGGHLPAAGDRRELPHGAAVRLARRPRRAVRVLERGRARLRPLREPAPAQRAHRLAVGGAPPRATRPTRCPTRRARSRSRSTPRGPRARWCRSRSSAGTGPREEIAAAYRRLLSRAAELYAARRRHAEALREDGLRIDTPDDRLDLALEWAKVNLDEQRVCNPDLGCGLVAGWGPSGEGARPGFGWFFGGDAAINSLAMAATGQWADGGGGPALPREVPARGRQDPPRGVAGGRRRPVVRGVPVRLLPRRHHAVLAPGALAAVEGERGPGAPRRALAGGAEGVGLVPAPRHGRRRDHREHDRRPGGDRGGVDRRGHPPGRVPGRGVDARGGGDGRDGGRAGRGRPRGAGARARGEGPGLDRVALLDRGRRAPRLRGAALGADERHAHRVAGHGGGVLLSSSPPTPAARSRRSRPTR